MIYIFSCIPLLKWANLAAPSDKEGPFNQVRNPLNIVGEEGCYLGTAERQNKTKQNKI